MKINLYTVRLPFATSLEETPFELTQEYINEVIKENSSTVEVLNYRVDCEEVRDGTMISNGLEVPASRRDYYLILETCPKKVKKVENVRGETAVSDL